MTLAMLSWGQHTTLINTLESYKFYGLDKMFNEKIIYFQEISDEDVAIAERFGYNYIGSNKNVGIAKAYARLVEAATEDTFLFLENDWALIEPQLDLITIGQNALLHGDYFGRHNADVIRYRHRKNPGNPLWTRQFNGNEYTRPTHLLDAVHWTYDLTPNELIQKFPEIGYMFYPNTPERPHRPGIQDVLYYTSSKYANWTNNPTMFRTEFLREHILPRIGSGDAELDLQPWWEQQDFTVAYASPGLFTHRRL